MFNNLFDIDEYKIEHDQKFSFDITMSINIEKFHNAILTNAKTMTNKYIMTNIKNHLRYYFFFSLLHDFNSFKSEILIVMF